MPTWLRILFFATIALGCVLRFTNLDRKVYSHDETLTSLRTSGFLLDEFTHGVANRLVTVAELRSFQAANDRRGIESTVRALAIDDPQHPPAYYLLERAWSPLFENSIAGRRSLGAVFGALGIFAAYWLCRELLPGSSAWALATAALFAVSPFGLQYAQQAREYTLWELVTLVSSALLVRAQRAGATRSWLLYGLSIGFGLYTFLFFFFVLLAHTLYLFGTERLRPTRSARPFAIALTCALLAYAPWLVNLIGRHQTVADTNGWFSTPVPASVYAYKLLFNLGAVFFDAEYINIWLSIVLIPLLILAVWSFYVASRSRYRPLAIFVCALFAANVIPMVVPDLWLHQSRATAARYLAPAWIALDLAVAFALCAGLDRRSVSRKLTSAVAGMLIALGIISWAVSAPAQAWWTGSSEEPLLSIARVLDAKPEALTATGDAVMALNLSNYLPPTQRFRLSASPSLSELQGASGNGAFLIAPSPELIAALERAPSMRVDLAYEALATDSPMLRNAAAFALPALRRKLASIRMGAGLDAPDFSVWRVTSETVATRQRLRQQRLREQVQASHEASGECTPRLGSWVDIQATSAGCRPFSENSPLNRRIPAGARLMPHSAKMIEYLLTKTGGPPGTLSAKCAAGVDPKCAGEHTDYGHPVYAGRPSDPVWTIHCTNPFGGSCQPEGARIHIPANARPAGGTDHHLAVIEQTTNKEYDFWGFCLGGPPISRTTDATDEPLTIAQCAKKYGGRLQTSTGAIYDLDAAGVWSTHVAGRKNMEPDEVTTATASGIALFGGAARVSEFAAGAYPHHAGFMVLPCSNGSAVYPMSHFDTPCSDLKSANPPCSWDPHGDCGIPYGARWFIDLDDAAIDACTDGGVRCSGPVRSTLKMIAHYGMFFGDTNGEYGWGLNGILDDWADQAQFGIVPTYTYFESQGLTKRDSAGNLIVPWPAWMTDEWFAVHSHFADPCVSRGDCESATRAARDSKRTSRRFAAAALGPPGVR